MNDKDLLLTTPEIIARHARRAQRERLLEALTNWATAFLWVGIFLLFLHILWRIPQ